MIEDIYINAYLPHWTKRVKLFSQEVFQPVACISYAMCLTTTTWVRYTFLSSFHRFEHFSGILFHFLFLLHTHDHFSFVHVLFLSHCFCYWVRVRSFHSSISFICISADSALLACYRSCCWCCKLLCSQQLTSKTDFLLLLLSLFIWFVAVDAVLLSSLCCHLKAFLFICMLIKPKHPKNVRYL